MATTKRAKNVKAELRKLADVVQREVDAGADSVEEIHRAIARMPLDVLGELDVLQSTVKNVRKAQETSISAVYELIHKVNHEVGKLAKDLLDGPAARRRQPTRQPVRKSASKRRATARA